MTVSVISYLPEQFPLLLAAAFRYPKKALRTVLQKHLSDLLEECAPRYSADQVGSVLSDVRGTVIEPFVLDAVDLEMAIYVARLAFSVRGAQTRLRIVSRETSGIDGGLVLTDNLRGYYAERFALGTYRHTPHVGWFLAPAAIPVQAYRSSTQTVRHAPGHTVPSLQSTTTANEMHDIPGPQPTVTAHPTYPWCNASIDCRVAEADWRTVVEWMPSLLSGIAR